jgi:hypothetical protein
MSRSTISNVQASDEAYRTAARRQYQREGEIEVQDNAVISRSSDPGDPGAYVQAWVWVYEEDAAEELRRFSQSLPEEVVDVVVQGISNE